MGYALGDGNALERESVRCLKGIEDVSFWSLSVARKTDVIWSDGSQEGQGIPGTNRVRTTNTASFLLGNNRVPKSCLIPYVISSFVR